MQPSKASVLVFLGNSSVGLIGVALWRYAPVVLPAVLLPVATLHLAYGSTVREAEERDRFRHLCFGPASDADLAALRLLGDSPCPVVGSGYRAPAGWREVLARILGLSSDGILLLDGTGRVRLWNEAMERITGVPGEEAAGLPYDRWLAGPDPGGAVVTLEGLLAGTGPGNPRASAEVRVRTSEGLERWLRCNHSLLFEGGAWTTDVVIVHDVTAVRQAERLKADFVATVSHELRTPITPIKGYVELLRSKGPKLAEEKREEILRVIAERAEHMARLVEDLLLASRISAGRPGSATPGMHPERTDVVAAARKAAADWLRDPACRLVLELPAEPLEVDADPMRLSQILANLLSNAHKYSPPDRPVVLALGQEGGSARASVVDLGRGIPREELERVFDKFHRVEDPMTMTTGGTGLGLYIARELARAMGGDVEAASVMHRGSTFTLRLPLAEAATRELDGMHKMQRLRTG